MIEVWKLKPIKEQGDPTTTVVKDESVEFEKKLDQVQEFKKVTNQFREIYKIYQVN